MVEKSKAEEILANTDGCSQDGEQSPCDYHLRGADAGKINPLRIKSTSFLPPKTIERLQRITERNRELFSGIKLDSVKMGVFESMPNIPQISFSSLNDFPVLSDAWTPFQDMVVTVQPKMFESARAMARIYESISKPILAGIDFEGIKMAMLPLQKRMHVLEVMKESNWPLYLVGNDFLTTELENISLEQDGAAIAEEVAKMAFSYLDEKWLASVSERWSQVPGLESCEADILVKALGHHGSGDYAACVSILMCMLEGLIVKYFGSTVVPDQEDEEMMFNAMAEEYGLVPISERKGSKGKLCNVKDIVLIALLRAEDGGQLAWRNAISYLIQIVLTNNMDEEIAAHNPLRNKICHGAQTNYGTKEHSLKAILATDLVIRLGCAALEGSIVQEGDDGEFNASKHEAAER